ncbi:MAG: copper amine oxidase N-terminal domain-containing protein [Tissierellia bacterium]|nr:copper amine oxidase N-terminal domain-containing protein [Tissierellia bacterium]
MRQSDIKFKKIIFIMLFAMVLQIFIIPNTVFAKTNPKIYISDKLAQSDVSPYIENDRTMVPLRVIAENLGYKVEWDGKNYEVNISNKNLDLKLFIGKKEVINNGKVDITDVAPVIKKDRTFVPLRYIAEAFNQVVIWDEASRSVYITREQDVPTVESDYIGRFVLINNSNLSKVDNDKKTPESLKVGDIGLIMKTEGNLLYLNLIKPVGDAIDDWSFAEGYVPKENCILNPRDQELEILSNVCRLRNGEIQVTDSVNGKSYMVDGNRFVKIKKIEKDRILIELPGGANDAWVTKNNVDFNFEYFIGNPSN